MKIKTMKELSFGMLVDQGLSKEQICNLKNLTPEAYDKAYASLMKIREEQKQERKTVGVTIEGRKVPYFMDAERREFRSAENPDEKIPFDTDEPILITSFTCPICHKTIDRLDYKESGTYDFKEDDYIPEKLDFLCPTCHISLDKALLKMLGVSG